MSVMQIHAMGLRRSQEGQVFKMRIYLADEEESFEVYILWE